MEESYDSVVQWNNLCLFFCLWFGLRSEYKTIHYQIIS